MAKLKDLLKESLGKLPSETLMKMKWNPVTEQDVFDSGDDSGDVEKDVEKLKAKFAGPLEPAINLINTKFELVNAIEALIGAVEENKPGLVKQAKTLLKKSINDI